MERLKNLANFLLVTPALAQEDISILPGGQFERLGDITIGGIVGAAIRLILIVAALVAFIFLIIGGIRWITSGGDKEGTAKAQSTITAALIGLVIVFAAWAIIKLIETFFGIEILTLTIPVIE
jgi:hypothetical protein